MVLKLFCMFLPDTKKKKDFDRKMKSVTFAIIMLLNDSLTWIHFKFQENECINWLFSQPAFYYLVVVCEYLM